VAVTKTHPPEVVQEALAAGLKSVGENKVQEAKAKREALDGDPATWHLLGHLQGNKAKIAARTFDWIQSIDSLEIAQLLNRFAEEESRHLRVLLQVNISGENTKYGISPDALSALSLEVNNLSRLELRGLMTMAPYTLEIEKTRPVFAGLREARDRVEKETGLLLPDLSMGMSGDFPVAIEEGATLIRLGTALFGQRSPPVA
jgi:PLP dependent protein